MTSSLSEYKLYDQILKSTEESDEEVFPVQAKSNVKMMPPIVDDSSVSSFIGIPFRYAFSIGWK